MHSYRFSSHRSWLLGLALGAAACNQGDIVDGNLSGGSGAVGATGDTGIVDGTAAQDTGQGTVSADGSTGNGGGGGDANTDGPGGIEGEECQGTQQGLCETPGLMVYCYSGADGTCDVGLCQGGVQVCEGLDLDLGQWSDCMDEVLPAFEICDGLDNDCDGQADEALGASICGLGVCAHDVSNCVDGEEPGCDPLEGASDEVCDGDDNDCDGDIDEDFAGLDVACGVGQCEHTVAACVDGVQPTCDPFEGALAEVCDNLDNDCDGSTDEGLGTLNCGVGVCNHDVQECLAGVPQICDPWQGATAEECDGLDNDCDGATDEGFGIVNCGVGICQHDVNQCVGGMLQVCDPFLGAGPEICDDGLDNDCDGVIDDGCTCGNGSINGAEQCDGAALGGATCVTLGHDGGSLACNPDCTFNPSGCYDCGDGNQNPGEQCDGADLNGQTCTGLGHDGGQLTCNANCTFNQNGCYECGDGAINPGESCDGANLGGQTCVTLGHDGGTLSCTAGCNFNQNNCTDCGDGTAEGVEECDGADLNGATCATLGFDGGTLACAAGCGYDTAGCYVCAMMPIGGYTTEPGPIAAPGGGGGGGGGGGVCAGQVIETLTCSSTYNGQVLDGASSLDGAYTCGDPYAPLNQPENEDVYEFTCQANGPVELLLSGMDCDLDIYVLDNSCNTDAGCLNGSTVANTANDSVIFDCVAGQTYYIIIEGYGWQAGVFPPAGQCNGDEGNYTLEFTVGDATGGCLEDCDDGIDNDSDGDIDCADSDCAMDPVCLNPCP